MAESDLGRASSEPLVYRPLSFLAIAGVCLGGLYAGLVAITSAVAIVKGAPFFLPGWMALMAVGGTVLSLLGLRQIRNAEGVLAGESIARWGIGLSVVTGLGYSSYVYFTGLALIQQANQFVMEATDDDSGFFPRFQEGIPAGFNRAFLLTQPYDHRLGRDPKDEKGLASRFDVPDPKSGSDGPLSQFRDNPLVETLMLGNKNLQVEPLGVREWKFEQGGYQVYRTYRITTPEVILEGVLPVFSTEAKSTEGDSDGQRKWFAALLRFELHRFELTGLGYKLRQQRDLARPEPDTLRKLSADKFLFPKDFPERFRDKLPKLIAQTDPDSKSTFFALDDDSNPRAKPWPIPTEKLGDGRFRFSFPYKLQVEPGSTQLGLRARVLVHMDSKQPYDPEKDKSPVWELKNVEITRFSTGVKKKM